MKRNDDKRNDVPAWLGARVAGASITAGITVGGRVAEWLGGRVAGVVWREGQGDSCFSFPPGSLIIHLSSHCVPQPVTRPHSDHLFVFSLPPESLTRFAPGLCRIERGSLGCWGVGFGSPTRIRGMLVGEPLTGDALAAALRRISSLVACSCHPLHFQRHCGNPHSS